MPVYYPKIKPAQFKLSGDWWISWPYAEISVAALRKHPLGEPKYIQGMAVRALQGGSKVKGTYWRWDYENGFTDGEYSNGTTPE